MEQHLPKVNNWDFTQDAPTGWVADITPDFRIGLWVMPNNRDSGYFEHFLTELVNPEDESLKAARQMLEDVANSGHQRFPDLSAQKALLSLYLAIQEEPGMSPTTALRKGLLNHQHPLAQRFVSWYEETFRLPPIAQ